MSDSVIKVSNLSKRYRLGLREKQENTLAGQVVNLIKSPWENLKRLRQLSRFGQEDESVFWALKDVSFEVKEGEVLGIIGKNGAGKSTLLKILSQITEPTSGKIEIHGRVASLLEVGTGFHPELSGRENIYMNGTILGMTRREIDSKLDEIIDFSGVEKFIDTPVKFYSSGMKVRLGFSVAAHLDPEILIVDEVLAVGDLEFQKKCMGKMGEVSKNEGRSILFVSHNLKSLSELSTKGILIENGKVILNGEIDNCIKIYTKYSEKNQTYLLSNQSFEEIKKPTIVSVNVQVIDVNNGIYAFTVGYKSPFIIKNPIIGIVVSDEFGTPICGFNNRFYNLELVSSNYDNVNISVKGLLLHSGKYYVSAFLGDPLLDFDSITDVVSFEVANNKFNSTQVPSIRNIGGVYLNEITWNSSIC